MNCLGQAATAKPPIKNDPKNAAKVPSIEMPPEVPFSTFLPLIIWIGDVILKTPNSVAQVSAFTAASEPANANQGQASPGKN